MFVIQLNVQIEGNNKCVDITMNLHLLLYNNICSDYVIFCLEY